MPNGGSPERSRPATSRAWRRGWRGWCLLGLAAAGLVGGISWWLDTKDARLGPVLSPERQRQEALAFLRMAFTESGSRRSGDTSPALRAIAEAQAGAGDVASAIETAKVIEWPHDRGAAWVAVAAAQLGMGDRLGSQQSLAFALKSATDAKVEPATQTAGSLVLVDVACAQARDGAIEEAGRTVQLISDPSCRTTAWCAVAKAQYKEGDIVGCRQSVTAATGAAREISNEAVDAYGHARISAWCAVATTQTETGDIAGRDQCFALATEEALALKTPCERAESLMQIGAEPSGAARDRTFALALEIARADMDAPARSSVIASIGCARASHGDLAGAEAAMTMVQEDDRDRLLGAVANFQAEHDDLRVALATARKIKDNGQRVFYLLWIIGARRNAGDVLGQREGLAIAIAVAREITNTEERETMLGELASAQAWVGDLAGAVRTLDGKWNNNYLRAWSEIAIARAKAGDVAGASELARRLRPKRERWWNHAWERFVEEIDHWRGRTVPSAGEYISPHASWITAMCGIATAQARTGDRKSALDTIRELPEEEGGLGCYYQKVAEDLLESSGESKAPLIRNGSVSASTAPAEKAK